MSEHYDFHYQPTGSGAISGQQVLEQTEDAINELGDYVNDNVGGAMDVAQQALETAQTAETNAQTALDTANSFSDAIQSAQQDASTALSTAQTAQTTASNANNTAIQASQDANTAVTTANNASGQVSTLSGTVTALGQRVTTAEGNIGQNTSDITALTTRVGTAEGNITTLQNDVSIAQGNASSAMATAGQVKQQAYVFRYSSTALTPSSTNSNSLLDNTDNLKVGDKVIDSSGVLFSITAIDTANSTFTIGTALIDLADDSDVVHKSGDETISGVKSFINYFLGKDLSGQTVDLNDCIDAYSGAIHYYYAVSNYTNISNKPENKPFILESKTVRYVSSIDYIYYQKIYTADYNASPSIYTRYYRSGSSSWSNWIKDTDKFVTTDTNQTISGAKTFSDNLTIGNTDSSQTTKNLIIRSSKITLGDNNNDTWGIIFNANNSFASRLTALKDTAGTQNLQLEARTKDSSNNLIYSMVRLRLFADGASRFEADTDNTVSLGSSSVKFKDVNTYLVNGVEPSSLGMPDFSNAIDISSYITVTGGSTISNSYTPPNDGYISVNLGRSSGAIGLIISNGKIETCVRENTFPDNHRECGGFIPVQKNDTVVITSCLADSIIWAYFIPCQGNV